jgi:hypothetical protein
VSDSQRARLATLFLQLFSADELRRFFAWTDRYKALHPELPEHASPKQTADTAASLLLRDRLVDGALFDAIRKERPRRVDDLAATARDLGVAWSPDGAPPAPPAPAETDMSQKPWASRHETLIVVLVVALLAATLIVLLAT